MNLFESKDDEFKNIINFYYSLENYELEVALIDILLIYYAEIEQNFKVKNIYITQPVNDYEIDAIVIDYRNSINIYQISKAKKTRCQLKKFLNDSTLNKYSNVINASGYYKQISRQVATLEKSLKIDGVDTLSDTNLFRIIDKVWQFIGINEENISIYKENIQIRSAFWERINVHRKKGKTQLVEAYLNIMLSNHYSLINSEFQVLKSIEVIENFNFDGLLTLSTNMTEKEKLKKMLLFKSSIVFDGNFHEIYYDVENLVDYLIALTEHDFNNYVIVPRCKYISIKDKNSSEVIAYYPYKYNQEGVYSSHAYGFKCLIEDIDSSISTYNKIQARKDDKILINVNGTPKEFKHGCSFKTPVYFVEPDLNSEQDLHILKNLFEISKSKINKIKKESI